MFVSLSHYSSTTAPAIYPLLVRFSKFLKKLSDNLARVI